MNIKVSKLREKIIKYGDFLEKYENNYMNFYKELDNCKSFWNDSFANYFFDSIVYEKKSMQCYYSELLSLKKLYEFIVKKYEKFGKKLYIDVNEDVIVKFNKVIEEYQKLISRYNYLDCSFDVFENEVLMKNRDNLIVNMERVSLLRDKYKDCFDDVRKFEREIFNKIKDINIVDVKENDIRCRSLGSNNEFSMNIDMVVLCVNKLNFFIKEEDLMLQVLNDLFNDSFYETGCSDRILELERRILVKFKILIINHKNNVVILNEYIDKYKSVKGIAVKEIRGGSFG